MVQRVRGAVHHGSRSHSPFTNCVRGSPRSPLAYDHELGEIPQVLAGFGIGGVGPL